MKLLSFGLVLALAGANGAAAQTVRSSDPQSIVRVMQEAGYKAELTKDGGGDPMIRSSSGGAKFSLFFYGCTDNKDCTDIQFYAGWTDKASAEQINGWNAKHRFGRAYLDDKGEVCIEYDINFEGESISATLFRHDLELWAAVMGAFADYIAGLGDPKAG